MRVVGLAGDYDMDAPGLVFGATEVGDDWPSVRSVLLEAFRLTQQAVAAEEPIVYVVSNEDLLGRNGPGSAAVACGLVSAARTASIELAQRPVSINVLAIDDEVDAAQVERWVVHLLGGDGPQGELIHLGHGHLGKALS
jgi:hypothetical protein